MHDELTIIRSPRSPNIIEKKELNANLREIHLKFELKSNKKKCNRRINDTNVRTVKITMTKCKGCKNDIL